MGERCPRILVQLAELVGELGGATRGAGLHLVDAPDQVHIRLLFSLFDLLGSQLGVIGIEAELGLADVDAASHLLSDGPPDGLPPLPYLGGDGPGVEEAAGIVGAEAEASFLRLVAYDQLVVEEEVQLPVTAWDQAEGADVVGESLQYLARYPSGPEGVSSGYAVLDSDIELFDAAVVHRGAPPTSQIGTRSKREAPDRADAIIPQAIGPLAAGRRDYSPNDGYDTNSCVRRLPAAGGPPTPRKKRMAGRARVFVAAPGGVRTREARLESSFGTRG